MARNPIRLSFCALATLALAACSSSDGGTNNTGNNTPATPTPTALVIVSGNNQTGTVGQALAAAIQVRVNDQSGSAMANVAVGFAVTQGGGTVAAASVTTGNDGRASTNWTLGDTADANHKVTATVTSATSVTGTFSATGTAAAPTTLTTTSPANQFGPTGGTLPDPIVVTVEDAFGNGVEGETVNFAVAASSGSVNPTTDVTDVSGQASTVWTLENAVSTQTLDVDVPAEAAVAALQFTVDAISLFLASVSPDPLVEGVAATLTGTGFDPTEANNTVTMGGVAATVNTATATQLDVVVPDLGCQPAQDVAVQVTVASIPSNTVTQASEPASFLSLAVGEQLLITDPASFCLQFAASSADEAYLIGLQSVSELPSSLTDVQLVSEKDPAAPAPPPTPLALLSEQGSGQDLVITDRTRRWTAHLEAHASFQSRQLAMLNRLGAGPAMASGPAAIPPTAAVGDTISLNVPDLNGSNLCLAPIAVMAEVKHIGAKGVWLEDIDNPAGGFEAADYQSLSDDLDNTIFDTDVAEFGDPTDLDANGRIGILVTQEVNKVGGILGFVFSGDLVSVASCAASNFAELYYGIAPDSAGAVGFAYPLASALGDAPPLIAHEFVHIIQFGVRLTAGSPFLSQWEAEGGATLGEEVVGHATLGNSAGQNYDAFVAIVTGFDWYLDAFLDMELYYGWNTLSPTGKVTGAPQQCTWLNSNPVSDGSDLDRPCVGTRQVYGTPWSFLRWLSDHFDPSGALGLQKAIVSGTTSGFANISAVVGEPISTLLAQWAAALYVDDRVVGADARLTMPSWDLLDVFEAGLNTGLHLVPTALSFADFTETFKVRGASTGYFRISGTTRPATAVRARDLADLPLLGPPMQLWVVRLQ